MYARGETIGAMVSASPHESVGTDCKRSCDCLGCLLSLTLLFTGLLPLVAVGDVIMVAVSVLGGFVVAV